MAFEIKQSLRLSQQLVMTPQLQQAIKLLQLNRMELQELVTQEMMENPILEEGVDASSEAPSESGELGEAAPSGDAEPQGDGLVASDLTPAASTDASQSSPEDQVNWENYIEEFNSSSTPGPSMKEVRDLGEELPNFENALIKTTSLEEHLLWQLSMAQLSETELRLGQAIIGHLSDEGYLRTPLPELLKDIPMDLEDAEELLKMIQAFDPMGIASRDLKECLLTQARFMNPRQALVESIIESHLPELERRNYPAIARALGVPLNEVTQATRLILEFEPKPARSFMTSDTQYITPDIYVVKVSGEFVISLNEDGLPKLRISPYYKSILQAANSAPTAQQNKLTKEYVQDKLRSAVWLIRSIHNRQKTIYKVTEAIVKRQRDFFEKGVQYLKPMVLRDVASDIGMHESTISRVTTNKFVHTPVGLFELKYFFNSSIQTSDGAESMASESVKERIRQLISKENPKQPFSDQDLVEFLKRDNIEIARRTVAKYREMLGILSSSKRRRML